MSVDFNETGGVVRETKRNSRVLAIISLILGIISYISLTYGSTIYYIISYSIFGSIRDGGTIIIIVMGLVTGLSAIVLGIVSNKKFGKQGVATTGIVLGILCIVSFILSPILNNVLNSLIMQMYR